MTNYVRVGKARIALKPVNATCSSGVDKAHYMLARGHTIKAYAVQDRHQQEWQSACVCAWNRVMKVPNNSCQITITLAQQFQSQRAE